MAYTKQNFEDGKPLYADQLNHIEQGIANVEEQMPQKTSDLVNDSGYITDFTETDPTVPNWAKQSKKPGYTAAEVGADPTGTAAATVSDHNVSENAHNDIRLDLQALATKLNNFLDSDDATLDELSELITAIRANAGTISQLTSDKVNVADIVNNLTTNVTNKPLSAAQGVALKKLIDALNTSLTNYQPKGDYALKSEIPSVPVQSINGKTGAVKLSASDVGALPSTTTIPDKTSQLTNDSGFVDGKTVADMYGTIFNAFPTESQIRALPNNSFFTVRAYGALDAENRVATYYRTKNWTRNALRFTDTDGATIYVVPVTQPMGEVYLPYYGIKTGEANAAANSAIMTSLLQTVQYGATFRFPVGHFWFSEPIDAATKHISIIGTVAAGYRHINITGTTFLHFTNLTEGEAALTVSQCTVADLTVWGNESQYSMELDRDEDSSPPAPTVNEIAAVKTYGILASGNTIIRDVGARNFYWGIWCDTANMMISNVAFNKCGIGLSIGNDIKCVNIFGFNVMVLLQMRGSLSSATTVRGDSVGKSLVEITGGGNHTLADLDADFCMGPIISIGDGVTVAGVVNLSVTGVHGRSGVSHVFASGSTEVTARNITADNAGEFGVLAVQTGSSLHGAVITTNQSRYSNPYDKVAGYRTPFVLLSAGAGTTVHGVQILCTAYDGDEITRDWMLKRIASTSALANACGVKVYAASGSITYSRSNGVETVIDDAADIYRRMDKSQLARKDEVVLTVNGIAADEDGNVEIVEQEPEVVSSADEMTDTTKKYVLPDGYIYAYRKRFVPGATTPNFTNQLPLALDPLTLDGPLNGVGYKHGVQYGINSEKNGFKESAYTALSAYSTGAILVNNGDVVRINAIGYHTDLGAGDSFLTAFREDFSSSGGICAKGLDVITNAGGKYTSTGKYENGILSDVEFPVNSKTFGWPADYGNMRYMIIKILTTTPPEDVIITVNEEITYTVTEDHYEWSWENTGELYTKPDYLGMIAALEARIEALERA